MHIPVLEHPTSPYIYSVDLDWAEIVNGQEVIHLGFYCPHCEHTGQGLEPDEIEAILRQRNEERYE